MWIKFLENAIKEFMNKRAGALAEWLVYYLWWAKSDNVDKPVFCHDI